MRVVYMGTPDFAVPALQAIIDDGHEVVLVVTQPDKARGRGGKVSYTPVKEKALEYGIEVFQPVRIRDEENVKMLAKYKPDIIVVAAFGQILSKDILDIPEYGCVNIHASLLPRWRGAAPIQSAIIEGDKQSGVTIMQMDEGLDTGDMIISEAVDITPDETGGSLHDKLAEVGGKLIISALNLIKEGKAVRTPQGDDYTYAKKLDKKMGLIDYTRPAAETECLIRGLNPWPGSYTYYNGKLLKVWKAHASDTLDTDEYPDSECGTIVMITKTEIYIKTGDGYLVLEELQPEGKKRMSVEAYLRGSNMQTGELLKAE